MNKLQEEFEKWWLDSDRFGSNSENWTLLHDDTLAYIQSLLDQQKQQILNLECLKEEEERWGEINSYYTGRSKSRNQLRKEIIDEIKKL